MTDDDWFDPPGSPPAATRPLSVVSDAGDDSLDPDWFFSDPAPEVTPPSRADSPAVSADTKARRRAPLHGWHLPGFPIAMGLVAITGAVVIAIAVLLAHHEPATAPLADAATTAPASPAATTGSVRPWCTNLAAGEPVSASPTDPGLAAIAAFEQAYYSGAPTAAVTARTHVAPDARVGSVEELAAGIATVPPGTVHCLLAQPVQPGIWAIELFARRPTGELDHYQQTISTIATDSAPKGALITAIIPRGDS